ncbi:kinase-like protein [Ascobolus immersus RN42]|uniref:non-specific serine/threonine protein kinase n=1 Tax=Ascobolus immersus RN42 TaxID=1160509 RepID=A0A3N4ID24_ASCIM|nr:kinase-like protein [Ascobolus immersus RN42]
MSLIPYSPREDGSEENIVFRHQRTLVLYDPHKQQLALRDAPDFEPPPVESNNCPYCQRPLRDPSRRSSTHVNNGLPEAGGHVRGEEHGQDEPGFVAPEYFRMLQATLPPPVVINPGRPDSPTKLRRLQQARVDEIEDSPTTDFAELSTPEDSNTSTPRTKISSDAFSPNYFERFFQVERELGRGGNGVVFLVRHELDGVSLGKFACKRVPVGNNHAWLEKVLNEVQLLQQLSHTNLVSYRHVWLEDMVIHKFGPSVPCAFILQQYCNAGDLHNYVLGPEAKMTKEQMKERIRRKSRGQPEPVHLGRRMLEFDEIISFFRDIASGINHLHSKGFIHRDLKPQNCLMNESGVPGSFPKVLVSDFGEVQMETAQRKSTGATGTISYCAPEVLQRVGPNGEYANFTTKSDVFSLGMILYFMCFGRLPYRHSNEEHEELIDIDSLRNEISVWRGLDSREKLRADLPEQLYRSLNKLLSPNPDARPSAEEILRQLEGMGLTEDTLTSHPIDKPVEWSGRYLFPHWLFQDLTDIRTFTSTGIFPGKEKPVTAPGIFQYHRVTIDETKADTFAR